MLERNFISQLPAKGLKGVGVAAFYMRFGMGDYGFALRMLMKAIGFAAKRIASVLEAKGGYLAAAPGGFAVQKREGPLQEGELRRAADWTQRIIRRR